MLQDIRAEADKRVRLCHKNWLEITGGDAAVEVPAQRHSHQAPAERLALPHPKAKLGCIQQWSQAPQTEGRNASRFPRSTGMPGLVIRVCALLAVEIV